MVKIIVICKYCKELYIINKNKKNICPFCKTKNKITTIKDKQTFI